MISIELDKIAFSYTGSQEAPLFSDFSLTIGAGEWVTLVGPTGAGKTTLIKLMKGLCQPQTGQVRINGGLLPRGELNNLAACVFANPENQIISPVVVEDVAFGLENEGLRSKAVRARVEEALRKVGLWEKSGDLSYHLSGGEQQRLLLAGVLALRKGCLLLDDSLCMVDGRKRDEMLRLLRRVNSSDSCTVVHTTHVLEEAVEAHRLVALENGKLLFDGSPKSFFQNEQLVERLGLEVPAVARLCKSLAASGILEASSLTAIDQLVGLLTNVKRKGK